MRWDHVIRDLSTARPNKVTIVCGMGVSPVGVCWLDLWRVEKSAFRFSLARLGNAGWKSSALSICFYRVVFVLRYLSTNG
jgi:hypothetical protein